jgi:hypothetical protein
LDLVRNLFGHHKVLLSIATGQAAGEEGKKLIWCGKVFQQTRSSLAAVKPLFRLALPVASHAGVGYRTWLQGGVEPRCAAR